MRKTTISYKNDLPNECSLVVSSWGGQETNNEFQPWHLHQFSSIANTGIELIYTHEDAFFTNICTEPFKHLSSKFYSLDLTEILTTQVDHNLIVIPHYRYYADDEWSTPLPVACDWQTSWWPLPMTIIFKYGPPGCITKFKKGEPFAQAIPIEIEEINLSKMTEMEKNQKNIACNYVKENKDKYITREWIMSSGVKQDNLYNVLCMLNRDDKLPSELEIKQKKFRILRSNNAKMVPNKQKQ